MMRRMAMVSYCRDVIACCDWMGQSTSPRLRSCPRVYLRHNSGRVRDMRHHLGDSQSAGRVVAETLNVSGMVRNRRLARAIADAGMAGFLAKLEYKCTWYGAAFAKADRWFASSKLCAHCGWKHDGLNLGDRQWWCGGCGALNERDHNAAVNLSNWPGLSFPVSGRGRLCKSGYAGGSR